LPVDGGAQHRGALIGHRAVQLVGGVGEQFYAFGDEVGSDLVERDAGLFEAGQHRPGVVDIFGQAFAQLAMIAERIQRRRRHRVDGVLADQFLDIEHVAVFLVLGAGRGPQQPLRLCPLGDQLVPTRT